MTARIPALPSTGAFRVSSGGAVPWIPATHGVRSRFWPRRRYGLGQDDNIYGDVGSLISEGISAASKAYQQTLQADTQQSMLQAQLARLGMYQTPYGSVAATASLSSTSMMPLLLIGGLFVVMMMAMKK